MRNKLTEERIISKGKQVIEIESTAISNLLNSINGKFVEVVRIIKECKGRVVLTGMGKSGLIARKIVATLNSTGTAAIYLHPTDALHGDLGMVRGDDVVILLSKSGSTEELINLLPLFKRLKVPLISITADSKSKLSRDSDISLVMNIKEEACPFDLAPTSSTTAMLVLGDAIAVCLLEMRGFTAEDFALLHPGGSLGKRLSLRINEIMYKGDQIPLVHQSTSLKDTIIEITSKRLGVTGVIDENGVLTGIITDGDLRRLLEKTLDIKELTALDIMSSNPKTISADVLASFALSQMEKHKITSLMVTDEKKKPIGILHLHDLVNLGLQRR